MKRRCCNCYFGDCCHHEDVACGSFHPLCDDYMLDEEIDGLADKYRDEFENDWRAYIREFNGSF